MTARRRYIRLRRLYPFLGFLAAVSLLFVTPQNKWNLRCLSLRRQSNCSSTIVSRPFIDSTNDRSVSRRHVSSAEEGPILGDSWFPLAQLTATASESLPDNAVLGNTPVYVDLLLAKGGDAADNVPILNRVLTADGWFDMQLASK